MSGWNDNIIEEFRQNGGRVSGPFEGDHMLILHSTGARSGLERLNPLLYRREGDRVFIFASKGGSPSHPDWYHNIVANPSVTVEIDQDSRSATAVEVVGDGRDAVFARQAAADQRFADYQANTDRTIPVVELIID